METVLYTSIPSPLDSVAGGAQGIRRPPQLFSAPVRNAQGIDNGAMLHPITVCVWWDNTPLLVAHIMRGNAIRHIALFAHICGSMRFNMWG